MIWLFLVLDIASRLFWGYWFVAFCIAWGVNGENDGGTVSRRTIERTKKKQKKGALVRPIQRKGGGENNFKKYICPLIVIN